MFGLKLNKYEEFSRDSETQLQVGEKLNQIT